MTPAHVNRPLADSGDPQRDADTRYTLFVTRLADRLRPVCSEWDEALFLSVVHRIAQMKMRWGEAYQTDPSTTGLPGREGRAPTWPGSVARTDPHS